jgi:hypothetical protein
MTPRQSDGEPPSRNSGGGGGTAAAFAAQAATTTAQPSHHHHHQKQQQQHQNKPQQQSQGPTPADRAAQLEAIRRLLPPLSADEEECVSVLFVCFCFRGRQKHANAAAM